MVADLPAVEGEFVDALRGGVHSGLRHSLCSRQRNRLAEDRNRLARQPEVGGAFHLQPAGGQDRAVGERLVACWEGRVDQDPAGGVRDVQGVDDAGFGAVGPEADETRGVVIGAFTPVDLGAVDPRGDRGSADRDPEVVPLLEVDAQRDLTEERIAGGQLHVRTQERASVVLLVELPHVAVAGATAEEDPEGIFGEGEIRVEGVVGPLRARLAVGADPVTLPVLRLERRRLEGGDGRPGGRSTGGVPDSDSPEVLGVGRQGGTGVRDVDGAVGSDDAAVPDVGLGGLGGGGGDVDLVLRLGGAATVVGELPAQARGVGGDA